MGLCSRCRKAEAREGFKTCGACADKQRQWHAANPERQREYVRKWEKNNPEKVRVKNRRNYESKPEQHRAKARRWRARNLEKHALSENRRRARLRDSCSPGVTPKQWQAICAQYHFKCVYCTARGLDTPGTTIDHVHPISRGGRDEPGNVVPACRPCNSSKGARTIEEWWPEFSARKLASLTV